MTARRFHHAYRVGVLLTVAVVVVNCRPDRASAELSWPRGLPETVTAAAAWAGVPKELLASVAWVESRGWPWALNIRGTGLYPRRYVDAVALVRAVHGRADIGIAQIHYPIWGPVFRLQPEDLLDPWINLHVAAWILRNAMDREPASWGGVGRYHSSTPWRKWRYARRVAAATQALDPASLPPRPSRP